MKKSCENYTVTTQPPRHTVQAMVTDLKIGFQETSVTDHHCPKEQQWPEQCGSFMLRVFPGWHLKYNISQEICTRFLLCCGYTLTDFPISVRLTSLALWQSNDCPSASKATLMNMEKYFMWIHYERLHNHNKAKHNKTVCMFLGIYCSLSFSWECPSNFKV